LKEGDWCKNTKLKQIILSKKGILKNQVSLSVATIFLTLCVTFLMTGALYPESEMPVIDIMLSEGQNTLTAQVKENTSIEEAAALFMGGLNAYDSANYPLDYQCTGGEGIIIYRAFDFTLNYNGETKTVKASNHTLKEILEREGIALSKHDIVSHPLDIPITQGIEVTITKVTYETRVSTEKIPFKTVEQPSNLVVMGERKVLSPGVPGKGRLTYSEKLIEGEVVQSKITAKEQLVKPQKEVVAVGKALATPYSKRDFEEIVLENGRPVNYEYIISGKSCAYTAGPRAGTASGRKLEVGTVAVNPKVIPYGSLVYVVTQDGRHVYGAAVAADTGSFITTDVVIDLYMGLTEYHYADACNWGAKYVDVYVINTGKY